MGPATRQDDPSVKSFFSVVETETLASLERLPFEFLEEFDVFAAAWTIAQWGVYPNVTVTVTGDSIKSAMLPP